MVVANFLLSPEAQLSKALPDNWGDLPVLDPALLPAEWQTPSPPSPAASPPSPPKNWPPPPARTASAMVDVV
jgi:ABC-type uncharacterized transport system YnjBCD substrate-binding protein